MRTTMWSVVHGQGLAADSKENLFIGQTANGAEKANLRRAANRP